MTSDSIDFVRVHCVVICFQCNLRSSPIKKHHLNSFLTCISSKCEAHFPRWSSTHWDDVVAISLHHGWESLKPFLTGVVALPFLIHEAIENVLIGNVFVCIEDLHWLLTSIFLVFISACAHWITTTGHIYLIFIWFFDPGKSIFVDILKNVG